MVLLHRDTRCGTLDARGRLRELTNQRAGSGGGMVTAVAAVGLFLSPVVLAAPGPSAQAEVTIAAVEMGTVAVATNSGSQVRVAVTGDTVVIQRKSVTLEGIKPNDFVGVTARREADGSLTAISINIFPPEFKGRVREAQFAMENGNIMTNATVFQNVRRAGRSTPLLNLGDSRAVITAPQDRKAHQLLVVQSS